MCDTKKNIGHYSNWSEVLPFLIETSYFTPFFITKNNIGSFAAPINSSLVRDWIEYFFENNCNEQFG